MGHVCPPGCAVWYHLVDDGARDGGTRGRARGKQSLHLYAMSYNTLRGQDRVPKLRGSDLSRVPLSATPALVYICSKEGIRGARADP